MVSFLAFSERIVTITIKQGLLESEEATFRCSPLEKHDLQRVTGLSRVVILFVSGFLSAVG